MTKKELERKLRRAGWSMEHGSNHDIAVKDGRKIPVPRHKGDIPIGTVKVILRRAGIE
jgi:predicted RNA binding protein YcfA (HicA-like mRNA interferase family)